MQDTKFWDIKETENIEELKYIHPYLLLIFADIVRFCYDSKIPAPIITCLARTEEEECEAGAETRGHMQRRALDLRSSIYNKQQIETITNYINSHWVKYAAKNSQGQVRGAVYHRVEGGVFHFHIQLSVMFALPEWKGLP
jgi:hypothetical protein